MERKKIFRDDQDRKDFLFGQTLEADGNPDSGLVFIGESCSPLAFQWSCRIAFIDAALVDRICPRLQPQVPRSGHLFQNRYKSIVCEEGNYLLELVRYIHLNPLRISAVKSLGELDVYPWSGHNILVGKGKNDWQEREYVLQKFHRAERKAIQAYRGFMQEGMARKRRPELVGGGLVEYGRMVTGALVEGCGRGYAV